MSKTKELRTRGTKPHDPKARAARITAAVRALEKIGAAFSVADVAERAEVSRATIYRSPDLRAIIGAKGNGLRYVEAAVHEKLAAKHETLKARNRALRRQVAEAEAGWEDMRDRAKRAEQKLAEAERRAAQTSGGLGGSLGAVAAHLGAEERRRARRVLARALHPDLFAQDPATAALATELLKTLNALAE